tara:strand:- start:22 stop:312 length:291 start_codon:yes stop_codon:yes gene_type:complete
MELPKAITNKGGFNLNTLQTVALGLVVLTVVVSIGAEILGQLQATQTPAGAPANITGQGLTAMGSFGDWFGVIVVVSVAVVILGLIMLFGAIKTRG